MPTPLKPLIEAAERDEAAVSPELLRGQRYTQIRSYLDRARGKTELTSDTYLLAQIALLLCDVLDAVKRQEEYLHEIAVHGDKK